MQIKREIATLKVLKHPNVVRLYEVLASKTKIYMVLEYVTGGELFEKIRSKGKLTETIGRKIFQQLIDGVSYCHNKGVFHRDLKLENVLVDAKGNIKITDFNLSALPQNFRIFKGDVHIPKWLSPGAKNMINKILDPNPRTRLTMAMIKEDEWFKEGYIQSNPEDEEENIHSYDEVLSINEVQHEAIKGSPRSSTLINAFQLIGMSSCLDLSGFFEKEDVSERKIRFTSNNSSKDLIERIEVIVTEMGFRVQKKNGMLKVTQERSLSSLSVAAELCNKLSNDLGVQQKQDLESSEIIGI
ncbi:hypothetical protein TanjilG_16656 [Lupinus angustifolius]|uniref:non-specific serine/threonine protein kinase n=1 Tax=Lupinus angustifolius TaxID=3871 RepID=A0A4P1QZK8_LUPAN|nr:hypothetical protein TanjilG_16656 [Lupinus angustifolius]